MDGCTALKNLNISSFDTSKVISMKDMFRDCYELTTTLTIRGNISSYQNMLTNAATNSGKIVLNYTEQTESLVDKMIKTKSTTSNVEKGELINN